MHVLRSMRGNSGMIGMFGHGDPDAEWRRMLVINLSLDTKPDWLDAYPKEMPDA